MWIATKKISRSNEYSKISCHLPKELTRMLLYLSHFTQGEKFHETTDFYMWKGYDFDILNELDDADYIR